MSTPEKRAQGLPRPIRPKSLTQSLKTWLIRLGLPLACLATGYLGARAAQLPADQQRALFDQLLGPTTSQAWSSGLIIVLGLVISLQLVRVMGHFNHPLEGALAKAHLGKLMAGVATLTLLFFVGAGLGSKDGMFGAEPAAWAQAGGSILALLIAVYVGQMGLEAEERRRKAARADQINNIGDAVQLALDNYGPVRISIGQRNAVALQDAFEQLANARQKPLQDLVTMTLPNWPSVILYSRVLAVEELLRKHREYADTVRPRVHADPALWNGAQQWDDSLGEAIKAYEQSIAGARAA